MPEVAPPAPFTSDVQFLEAQLAWIQPRIAWKKLQVENDRPDWDEGVVRRLQGEEADARAVADARARATETTDWEPTVVRLARHYGLSPFERDVLILLAGLAASVEVRRRLDAFISVSVGDLISSLSDSLEEQVQRRRAFYRTAPLVREGLITLERLIFERDLLRQDVWLDRRIADLLLGTEGESAALVDGAHLYRPTVTLDRVVLPAAERERVIRIVEGYPRYLDERRRSGLDTLTPFGGGLVLLFHGPSGTGKTMLANALAGHLGKRLLLVNFPTIGDLHSDDTLRYLFREARLQDAALFFDECEGIFGDRDRNRGLGLILTEIERHEGMVILATNRPLELDEAMQRRITLSVAFRPPTAREREEIWRAHVPPALHLSPAPDFAALAERFELTGGLIKNAVVSALVIASSRGGDPVTVTPKDLEEAARLQLRGRGGVELTSSEGPARHGLDDLVVSEAARRQLDDVVRYARVRRRMRGDGRLADPLFGKTGVTVLLHGPPGTGKTMAAEAVGAQLDQPVHRVSLAQVVSKWVGDGAKRIEELFREARRMDAILLFDEADALFGSRTPLASSTDRYANLEAAVLLREIEQFEGVSILTTNLMENIDPAFHRRLTFILRFSAPDERQREELWHLVVRAGNLPLAPDVSLPALAHSWALTGAGIRNAAIRAAARASGRADRLIISQNDLDDAAREEEERSGRSRPAGFGA